MKILHWYPSFLRGGAVANSVGGLSLAQSKLGVDVAIAAVKYIGRPAYSPLTNLGSVKIIEWEPPFTVRYKKTHLRFLSKSTIKNCLEFEPDIVHIHGEFNPDNLRVPTLFPCVAILSPRGGFHPVVMQKGLRKLKRIYFYVAQRFCYKKIQAFHAQSPMESSHISDLLQGSSVYCTPQGPSLPFIQRSENPKITNESSLVKLIFVGRLDVHTKGLDILLQAFAILTRTRQHPQVTLTLVGPDFNNGRHYLENLCQELKISEVVNFTGVLTGQDLWNSLASADIYTQISRNEALSSSVMEALFMNLPVIVSQFVGVNSFLEVAKLPHVQTVNVDAQEVASAILHCIDNLDEFKQIAQESNDRLQELFSWEKSAKNHLENYEVFLKNKVKVTNN